MTRPSVRDITAPAPLPVDVQVAPAFELLVGLSTLTDPSAPSRAGVETWLPERLGECSPALQRAIEAVGSASGELWLHLLGLAIELPAKEARTFVDSVAGFDAAELRRHAIGVHVPSWQRVAGADLLERAAAGDADAAETLLANERYYAGAARTALAQVLPLGAEETRERVATVLRLFAAEVFAPAEAEVMEALAAEAAAKRALAERVDAATLISSAARGFVYEPEPEAARVLLVPYLAAGDWLLLCQHRDTRIICYPAEHPAAREQSADEDVLRLARALADPARIRILRRLGLGEASLTELAEVTGLVKSTAHHHVAQLRAAGLVELRGNARAYRYALTPRTAENVAALVGELLGPAG